MRENLCHKPFVMTRQSILHLTFSILVIFAISGKVKSASVSEDVIKHNLHTQIMKTDVPVSQPVPAMNLPFSRLKANHPKHHLSKIEELGKIHRFHKERVRKAKKHSGKYWLAIKILLVCCHVALLIHAFMHLTH